MAREDVTAAVTGLSDAQLWLEPGGATPLGLHLAHLAGSTDRLLTYARGDALSVGQREALAREKTLTRTRPPLHELLAAWQRTVDAALEQLAVTGVETLAEPRLVGRAKLPSTVLGLLFHAAEHASRHTGQVVTTTRIVRASETGAVAGGRRKSTFRPPSRT
jgi:uncharacterized damage-inducible protein DinB